MDNNRTNNLLVTIWYFEQQHPLEHSKQIEINFMKDLYILSISQVYGDFFRTAPVASTAPPCFRHARCFKLPERPIYPLVFGFESCVYGIESQADCHIVWSASAKTGQTTSAGTLELDVNRPGSVDGLEGSIRID